MRETRFWKVPALECRAGVDGAPAGIAGYGAVFNRYSQNLGGFVEQVDPLAFVDTLSRDNDVKSHWNHDVSQPLGRRSAGNLDVTTDGVGLLYDVRPPATTYARDLALLVESRVVQGSSFTFRVLPGGDDWSYTDQGFPLRTLRAVELYELGPVTDPAYLDTEGEGAGVALRSLAVRLARPLGEVEEAAQANELRALIDAGQQSERLPLPDPDPAQHASRSAARRLALASRTR